MPGSGSAAEPGLIGSMLDAVRVAEDRAAGFRLPHVIDHRHAAAERRVLQPVPGCGIEHLAGADDALEAPMIDVAERVARRSASACARPWAR